MSLTTRSAVAVELAVLGAAAAVFLVAFPHRTIALDIPMALLGLALVGLDAPRTRRRFWKPQEPKPESGNPGRRGRALTLLALTVAAAGLFALVGAAIGYHAGGWSFAARRVFQAQMLLAFGFYLIWALLQQTLFQFYLLGRLRALLPELSVPALCALNGAAFAAVHWPNPVLMAVTLVAGAVWSWSYHEDRRLWPLALSHAALGSTFYYWVYGRDLASVWLALAR